MFLLPDDYNINMNFSTSASPMLQVWFLHNLLLQKRMWVPGKWLVLSNHDSLISSLSVCRCAQGLQMKAAESSISKKERRAHVHRASGKIFHTNTHKRWIICCFRCMPIYGNGQSVCRPKDGVKTAPTCVNNSSSSFWPMAKQQILDHLNYNTKRMFKSQMEVNIQGNSVRTFSVRGL